MKTTPTGETTPTVEATPTDTTYMARKQSVLTELLLEARQVAWSIKQHSLAKRESMNKNGGAVVTSMSKLEIRLRQRKQPAERQEKSGLPEKRVTPTN